ncbi:MFS general substrate transporter [Roridomyces roridus]|uniref:MFS general substrate transporter n=1 Tax=Roridomyces roridus TaxID=1738132 RepID=A0AAD7FYJ0_9AGAR|nr:MFS general substrate transporter [Roridomyces roridus]
MSTTDSTIATLEAGPDTDPAYEKHEQQQDEYLVSTLDPSEDPLCFSALRKWTAVVTICLGSFCVTCASSVASFTEKPMAAEFHVSRESTILLISLFVLGLGFGPLITGPFSEVYGRAIIYRISYIFLVIFSFPVVFAPNLGVILSFRFLLGFAGASFLSVAGGSVADMFAGSQVATPMAVYTLSPFLGPVFGPLIGGYINQNLYWRWTWRIFIIWTFAQLVAIFMFIPESYAPVLLKRKAQRLRKETGDERYWAPLDRRETSLSRSLVLSCYVPLQLLIFDRMALLLDTWTALMLGILYLMFQAFPIIFEDGHHFNVQSTGLSFIGIGIGMFLGLATQPIWNRVSAKEAAKHGGKAPPETALIMGQVGGILVPLALYWFAFTTYPKVHWVVPIIASVPFGTGVFFVFTATFTYLVTAYRPIAASAMASNSALRSSFAAAFPLFASAMYHRLGTAGATALLAGLATVMAPLPFVFRKIGPRLRAKSRFAV